MIPLHHLPDDELIELGNELVSDVSYYLAGWDYQNTAHERPAQYKAQRLWRHVLSELNKRGLRVSRPGLVG